MRRVWLPALLAVLVALACSLIAFYKGQNSGAVHVAAAVVVFIALSGIGFAVVENGLVYHPSRTVRELLSSSAPMVQDVELRTDKGTLIHAHWCPHPGVS